MPVSYLTADCIWNSFRSSGKRHLILTGTRGRGKSTLLKKLFPETLPGLTTWAERSQAVYLQEHLTGETTQVGVFDETLPGPENRMALLEEGFISLGVAALERCMESDSRWIAIDEIGYLEALCLPYGKALGKLLEKKQVAAVVRKQNLPFLEELCAREDAFVVDLDDPFGNIGCVIMASGLGKRFGGNKLLADFQGQPMISRILDATEGIFAQRVVVTRSEEVAVLCKNRGIRVVLHSLPHRSDTVRLGLEAMPGIDRCMFAAADQPLLRKETIAALAIASKNNGDFIWRTGWEGMQGSPVVFPGWSFPELQNLPEGKGGGVVAKKYPERLRMVNVRDMYELKDVDSPEDLSELLER
jgi:molybdenum cofactor cytidylyltransferase